MPPDFIRQERESKMKVLGLFLLILPFLFVYAATTIGFWPILAITGAIVLTSVMVAGAFWVSPP